MPAASTVQGDHCAEVVLTVSDFTVSGAKGAVPSSVSAAQKICWFKVSRQPVAKFDFDMCTNKKCEWGCGAGIEVEVLGVGVCVVVDYKYS